MKTIIRAIILFGSLLELCVAIGCKQFTADIDEYLNYWSSEAFIKSSIIETQVQTDVTGVASVASDKDVTVTLKLQNPQSFRFVMPSASETRNIVNFLHFTGTKPQVGIDYELKQTAEDTLQFIYKAGFLKKYEWGEQDLSSVITLYADDGRLFNNPFTLNIKSNTPPAKPCFTVAKTRSTPAYYVLCFSVPGMDKQAPGGLVHKDITHIEVNGTSYAFSVNEAQRTFVKPEDGAFITASEVKKLSEPEADELPTSSWVLYYKTDVEVKDGSAKKGYTVHLADAKGLISEILNANTKPNKAETETIRITKGEQLIGLSGDGSSEGTAFVIKAEPDTPEAMLEVKSMTAAATVHCTVTDTSSALSMQYDGNPVTVPLPLNGENEKPYKLEYYTDGTDFSATPVKTVYYKVIRAYTVSFNANSGSYSGGSDTVSKVVLHGATVYEPDPLPEKAGYTVDGWYQTSDCSGPAWNFATSTVTDNMTLYANWSLAEITINDTDPNAWLLLKQKVEDQAAPSVIIINGTITAPSSNQHIKVSRTVTIKGQTGKTIDKLDANNRTHIFEISGNGKLTLEKLTLQNGKNKNGAGLGGAIYCAGAELTVIDSSIQTCTAKRGAGIYAKEVTTGSGDSGSSIILTNTNIQGCTATEEGGGIYYQKSMLKMHGCIIGGDSTALGNKATAGGGIYFKDCTGFELTGGAVKNNTVTNGNGGGLDFAAFSLSEPAEYVISGCTISANSIAITDTIRQYSGGGIAIMNIKIKLTITDCTIEGNTIEGNTIQGTADKEPQGAGIWLGNAADCTIERTEIKDNKAYQTGSPTTPLGTGGGLWISGGILNIKSGTKIDSNAAKKGRGLYIFAQNNILSTVTMSGTAKINENNDVFLGKNLLYPSKNAAITIADALDPEGGIAACLTPEVYPEPAHPDIQVLKEATPALISGNHSKFTVTKQTIPILKEWKVDTDGKLKPKP